MSERRDGREAASDGDTGEGPDVPPEVIDEGERQTRLARQAVDGQEAEAYRAERDGLFEEYDYETRIREDRNRDVFVAYPTEWLEDGTLQPTEVDDVDRGIERPLSGAGDPDEWHCVAERNDEVVERVAADHDEVHAQNARALADYASNHYAKPIEGLTEPELRAFLAEYFPRNTWPSERQRALVEDSIELTYEKLDVRCPL